MGKSYGDWDEIEKNTFVQVSNEWSNDGNAELIIENNSNNINDNVAMICTAKRWMKNFLIKKSRKRPPKSLLIQR